MYIFKKELKKDLLKGVTIRYLAEQIGISEVHLANLLNGRYGCRKTTAYCIVKFCDENKEISDYFIVKNK